MHFSYVLINMNAAAVTPLYAKICSDCQNFWCVDFLCKYTLDLDHPRVSVRAELRFCCWDSSEAHAELLRRESTMCGTIRVFTDRWQASRALELCATHYLKMSFTLLNTSLVIVGELSYTHLDFSLREQEEMGISQSRPACQRRLTFASYKHLRMLAKVSLFSVIGTVLKLLILSHAHLQLPLVALAITGLADSQARTVKSCKANQNFP